MRERRPKGRRSQSQKVNFLSPAGALTPEQRRILTMLEVCSRFAIPHHNDKARLRRLRPIAKGRGLALMAPLPAPRSRARTTAAVSTTPTAASNPGTKNLLHMLRVHG
jgi:hypothetical protein